MGKVCACTLLAAVGGCIAGDPDPPPSLRAEATVLCVPSVCVGTAELANLPTGFKARLDAFHVYTDAAILANDIAWSWTPQTGVVAFDGFLRGAAPGAATVTAMHADNGTHDDVAIHVHPLLSITVLTPMGNTVPVGARMELVAMGNYGSTINGISHSGPYDLRGSTESTLWTSGDVSIARIEAPQFVRGVTPGQTTITATYGGFSGTIELTVQ